MSPAWGNERIYSRRDRKVPQQPNLVERDLMSLQNDSKRAGAMLVTIHHFPGHVIISMSLSISRNWLCFDCCCVLCNRRGGRIFLPSPELELANLDSGSKRELGYGKRRPTSLAKA